MKAGVIDECIKKRAILPDKYNKKSIRYVLITLSPPENKVLEVGFFEKVLRVPELIAPTPVRVR